MSSTLSDAVEILQIVNLIEPSAIALVKSLLQDLSGKSVDQILTMADDNWATIIAKAKQELANLPPQA